MANTPHEVTILAAMQAVMGEAMRGALQRAGLGIYETRYVTDLIEVRDRQEQAIEALREEVARLRLVPVDSTPIAAGDPRSLLERRRVTRNFDPAGAEQDLRFLLRAEHGMISAILGGSIKNPDIPADYITAYQPLSDMLNRVMGGKSGNGPGFRADVRLGVALAWMVADNAHRAEIERQYFLMASPSRTAEARRGIQVHTRSMTKYGRGTFEERLNVTIRTMYRFQAGSMDQGHMKPAMARGKDIVTRLVTALPEIFAASSGRVMDVSAWDAANFTLTNEEG